MTPQEGDSQNTVKVGTLGVVHFSWIYMCGVSILQPVWHLYLGVHACSRVHIIRFVSEFVACLGICAVFPLGQSVQVNLHTVNGLPVFSWSNALFTAPERSAAAGPTLSG